MNTALDFIHDHGVLVVACLAVVEGFFCAILLRRAERMRARLRIAIAAAEDAARAAALAAPGGIDPEIVIHLLRAGRATSLESVYQLMEQQIAAEEEARQVQAQAEAARKKQKPAEEPPPLPPIRSNPEPPPSAGGMTDTERAEMQKRLGRYG